MVGFTVWFPWTIPSPAWRPPELRKPSHVPPPAAECVATTLENGLSDAMHLGLTHSPTGNVALHSGVLNGPQPWQAGLGCGAAAPLLCHQSSASVSQDTKLWAYESVRIQPHVGGRRDPGASTRTYL